MAFGFPASFSRVEQFDIDPVLLRKLVLDAFARLEWKYDVLDDGTAVARVPMNANSWGEKVIVSVDEDASVRVRSACVWPLQLVDFWANRRNVDQFFMALTGAIRNSTLDPRRPPTAFDADGQTPIERALKG